MIRGCILLALLGMVVAQLPPNLNNGWRRKLDNEQYFYNGIDAKVEDGWSDERAAGVKQTYRVVLVPAQGLAQLNYSSPNGDWRLVSKDGYDAKPEDQIIFRVKGEQESTPMILYAGPAEGQEPIQFRFAASPLWRLHHVPLKALSGPTKLKVVGLRNDSGKTATVYVAYMYLKSK